MACLLAAGCSSRSGASTTPRTLAQQVAAIVVQPGDLDATQQRRLLPNGSQLAGQVTMDNCGFDFTTERFRVARREYLVTDESTGQTVIGNQVVAYDTSAHAAQALDQWYRAAANCPSGAFRSAVAGVPPIRATIESDQRGVAGLPVKSNVMTVERQTASDIGVMYGSARLQQRGPIIDVVYVSSPTPITSATDHQALRLARTTGNRLSSIG